jgi:SP family general alpha glucoside:H+ symporter-like MFS transporter
MLQWVWPVPLAIGAFLAPESPWNAIRRGNYAQARNSLMRLRAHGQNEEVSVDNTMAYMVHVTRLEQAETAGAGYAECFKGTNLRRTEIVSGERFAVGTTG